MLYKYWLAELCKPIMNKRKFRTFEKITEIFPFAFQSKTNSGVKIICVQKYMIALIICAYPWNLLQKQKQKNLLAGISFSMCTMSNYVLGVYNNI